ncbi:MAG TPA: Obg family GTPase CgtA, partial [Solirubrobacteraceae bacterium]
ELALHDPRLAALPRVLALSKSDLIGPDAAEAASAQWRERVGPEVPVLVTSSVTGAGLEDTARMLLRRVPVTPAAAQAPPALDELAEHQLFRPATGRNFLVERTDDEGRRFRVTGPGVERLLARYDLDNEEALAHLERRLRGIGVIRALEAQGFEAGDDVEIGGVEFDLHPGA